MVGKLLGQPTNTVVGRPFVLRGAGRVSEWISTITGKEPRISQESAALVSASIISRSDKAMRELDYRPASVETMLKECIDWMIAENLIGPRAVPH
jgi:dihydroflavonol-4-reductase